MRTISTIALLGALLATPALSQDVFGVWRTETNDRGAYLHVDVQPCGQNVCGKIVRNINGQRQEIVGRMIIEGMRPDGPNAWDNGTIWKPDDDETYDAEMELQGSVLKVSGCVFGGLICRSQDWRRVR